MKTFSEYWDGLIFGKELIDKDVASQVWQASRNQSMIEVKQLKKAITQIDFNMRYVEEYKRRNCEMIARMALGLMSDERPDYLGEFGGDYARSINRRR